MVKTEGVANKIAVVGNYLPRQCGIATFTFDLCEAMAKECGSKSKIITVAMNDLDEGYAYPDRVKFEIQQNVQTDYFRAAEFLNITKPEVTILQHEYGIFGGQFGSHLFNLVERLNMPLLTTLHTILTNPGNEQKSVIMRLAQYSEKLIVMSKKAEEILQTVYKIPQNQIAFIPHGIPDLSFMDSFYYKDQFGVEEKSVILTFGLLGPGKGLEFMIQAMKGVIQEHPDAVYIILGATHPHILRTVGEKHRHKLQQLIRRLGIENHVLFFNQFVDLETLIKFLTSADIFVTPYLAEEQIVSGTLSYALGAGKAVISTPYWYATELLANEHGVIVPFGDSTALTEAINSLLSCHSLRNSIRKRAYQSSRSMIWKQVARQYLQLARQTAQNCYRKNISLFSAPPVYSIEALPEVNLSHLNVLTDDTGILQHCYYSIPKREDGYCTDDNARALVAACKHFLLNKDESILPLISTYLSFLLHAYDYKSRRFRNFMSFDRKWLESIGSEDAHGRALWGLGMTIHANPSYKLRSMASCLFMDGVSSVDRFRSPRAIAFSLIGMHYYLNFYVGDSAIRKIRKNLAEKLWENFSRNETETWPWPENSLTYSNGKLPHALLQAGYDLHREDMLFSGIKSLKWLLKQETAPSGHISVIGNNGWMNKDGQRARFDQQPVEVLSLVEACAETFRITRETQWLSEAGRCFDWFMGRNDLNSPVYEFESGACHDGMAQSGVNENTGAESTLAFLISLLTMYELFGYRILMKEPADQEFINATQNTRSCN